MVAVFFFQAEDGIRDYKVTGVQTCALPISRLRLGQEELALKAAADYRDIFGADNFFLELMDHGLRLERNVRAGLLEIGRKLGLPPLAPHDSPYVTQDPAPSHDTLLCVQSGKT